MLSGHILFQFVRSRDGIVDTQGQRQRFVCVYQLSDSFTFILPFQTLTLSMACSCEFLPQLNVNV